MNNFKFSIVYGQSVVDVIDVLLYLKYDILFDRKNSLMRLNTNILDNIIQDANIKQQKEEYLKECFIQRNFTIGDMFQRNISLFKNFKFLQVTIPKF